MFGPTANYGRSIAAGILLAALGVAPAMADMSGAGIAALAVADVNRDRHLDRNEFQLFIDQMAAAGDENGMLVARMGVYRMAFRMIDENRDRLLSPNELAEARTMRPNAR